MVLLWIESNNPTLSSLVNLFKNYFDITISAQALNKKFNKFCIEFLMEFLEQTILMLVMESEVEPHGLLTKFTGTFIADCTSLNLSQATKQSFPGTGGKDKDSNTSGMKILLRVEIFKGIIEDIRYSGATTSDVKLYEKTKELPKGSLELVDMEFASQDRLLKNNKNNVFFVARIQSTSILYVNDVKYTLTDFLSKQNSDSVDVKCTFGSKKVPVRLEAKRLSEEDRQEKIEKCHT